MTAGTGIAHSERNGSEAEPVHLYQIWILPDRRGLRPGYEQRAFDEAGRCGKWQVVASIDGREGSLTIHQDATLSLAKLAAGQRVRHDLGADRHGWLQVLRGEVSVEGTRLVAGDGAEVDAGSRLEVVGEGDSEVLLFDLA
jgi:redox-sensitive bicupin YhaK (pirin superfamily)